MAGPRAAVSGPEAAKVILLGLLMVTISSPQTLVAALAGPPPAVVETIRNEATRRWDDPAGRPLPLAAHWNSGTREGGFGPDHQRRLIEEGHHLLPWVAMPSAYETAGAGYYANAFDLFARWRLPVVLQGTQWERVLSEAPRYCELPAEDNPNVVGEGPLRLAVSPFGPQAPWEEAGREWTTQARFAELQQAYPEPPQVIFLSNNEHAKLRWTEAETSTRYLAAHGPGKSDVEKRRIFADGWVPRYQALQQGMRAGLTARTWSEQALFVGYDAFGSAAFGRWSGWPRYSLHVPGQIEPWPRAWDGASVSYYVRNWDESTDFTVWSPQVEAMNWVFMLDEARRHNPDFWFEISTWDGHSPRGGKDKREVYRVLGQHYDPKRYRGMVQFGMWLLRPRVVREFRDHLATVEDHGAYFDAVLAAVDAVHTRPDLQRFWRRGALVANRTESHPYQASIPPEYANVDRWFLLSTPVNPRRPWTLDTRLAVFALARVIGTEPEREWMIYAHAPLGPLENVELHLPGHGPVHMDVSPGGAFLHVDERTGRTAVVSFPGGP